MSTRKKNQKGKPESDTNTSPKINKEKQENAEAPSFQTPYTNQPIIKQLSQQSNDLNLKENELFEDSLFPPTKESLYSQKDELKNYHPAEIPRFLLTSKKLLSQYSIKDRSKYCWKRLSEIFKKNDLQIMSNDISKDIIQGELGDCYYLSVMEKIAENPDRLKSILQENNTSINKNGIYKIKAYVHGEPVEIILDDYIPIIDDEILDSQIAFTGINENTKNIWPLLLEKAWAKCNLSYENIAQGDCGDAFRFLTPAPVDSFFNNANSENLFKIIQNSLDNGHVILADISNSEKTNVDNLAKLGLITNHGYSIVDYAVLKGPVQGRDIEMLKIKNLWGTNEWQGDWSDLSKKWTKEYKNQIDLVIKEDGIFWMSYDDYIRFYTCTHICRMNDQYNYLFQKFKSDNNVKFNIVKIQIPKKTKGYFMLNMKTKRIYQNLKGLKNYENPFCSMVIFKDNEDSTYDYIGADSGKQDRLYVECDNIIEGTYYICAIFPKENDYFGTSKKQNKNFTYRIGIYSSLTQAKIDPLTQEESDNLEKNNFFNEIITKILLEDNNDKYFFINEGESKSWRSIKFNKTDKGFGYIYYENNSLAYLRERITFTELNNINIIPLLSDGTLLENKTQNQTVESEEQENYDDYENNCTKIAKENLIKTSNLKSSTEIIQIPNENEPVSLSNPGIIQFNIAPNSKCSVLLLKSDNESSIDFTSDICFDYIPLSFVLGNKKFKAKKSKLKYNKMPVNIYEMITEHNTGFFFQYKNKTNDLSCTIGAHFDKLDNLKLIIINCDNVINEDKENNDDYFENNSVTITVKPGETKYFALNAINTFSKFDYTLQTDFRFSKIKNEDDEDESEN